MAPAVIMSQRKLARQRGLPVNAYQSEEMPALPIDHSTRETRHREDNRRLRELYHIHNEPKIQVKELSKSFLHGPLWLDIVENGASTPASNEVNAIKNSVPSQALDSDRLGP